MRKIDEVLMQLKKKDGLQYRWKDWLKYNRLKKEQEINFLIFHLAIAVTSGKCFKK